jgi:outer membrane PBP1 activator LpoA protein
MRSLATMRTLAAVLALTVLAACGDGSSKSQAHVKRACATLRSIQADYNSSPMDDVELKRRAELAMAEGNKAGSAGLTVRTVADVLLQDLQHGDRAALSTDIRVAIPPMCEGS